jgi:hypothetical protein
MRLGPVASAQHPRDSEERIRARADGAICKKVVHRRRVASASTSPRGNASARRLTCIARTTDSRDGAQMTLTAVTRHDVTHGLRLEAAATRREVR